MAMEYTNFVNREARKHVKPNIKEIKKKPIW